MKNPENGKNFPRHTQPPGWNVAAAAAGISRYVTPSHIATVQFPGAESAETVANGTFPTRHSVENNDPALGSKVVLKAKSSGGGDPYDVTFERGEQGLRIVCSCPAGSDFQLCKHRIELMKGDSTRLVSKREEPQLAVVLELVANSQFRRFLSQLEQLEELMESTKAQISKHKKEFARRMLVGL